MVETIERMTDDGLTVVRRGILRAVSWDRKHWHAEEMVNGLWVRLSSDHPSAYAALAAANRADA